MSVTERRQERRVRLRPSLTDLFDVLSAKVVWPNLEISNLIDLSFKGASIVRPGLFKAEKTAVVALELELSAGAAGVVDAHVVWTDLDRVGVRFVRVAPESHAALNSYLEPQLIAADLVRVEPELVQASDEFSHWFQSGSASLFVKLDGGRVSRAQVDLKDSTVAFARGARLKTISREERRALLLLSQMDKPGLPMEEFLRTLA